MSSSIYGVWDDPANGLTANDFARWPDIGGLSRLNRDKTAALLQGAFDNGDLVLPVYLIGKCSTYPTPYGHPAKAFVIDDWVTFAIWGKPGTPWARVATMKSKGLMSKRVESNLLPEFDHIELEKFEQSNGGYLDLQMSKDNLPTARIGLYWTPGAYPRAQEQARTISEALSRCRDGLLPNGG